MDNIFLEISLILVLATLVAGLMQLLRQPLIIGHILTGLLVGPRVFDLIQNPDTLQVFSHIGVALLLFIIGLSLNPRVIKEVGRISIITGLGQILFTAGIGYFLALSFGLSQIPAIYVAIAISFSSTIIVLKLLSDKKELGRLHGKIATGFLLVQDIVATLILIAVTSMSQEKSLPELAAHTGIRVAAMVIGFFLIIKFILPWLIRFFAKSQESLFLFAIGWGFGIASLFYAAGLSIEIGALFAGVALATSSFSYEISSRMRPLRDFFIILFFILLGSQMRIENLGEMLEPALMLSLFILIGNPIIIMSLMGIMGYTKKTSFKAGLAVSQISEFSLILIVLGSRVGHLSQNIISLITIVALITIAASTYMILYADEIYARIAGLLSIFERKKARKEKGAGPTYDVVIFGFDQVGKEFAGTFKEMGKKFVIVDYDPEMIETMKREKINYIYGDANDTEFLEDLRLDAAKLVISTVTDFATNALIVHQSRESNTDSIIVATSDEIDEATELYSKGATYIMMPHYISGTKTVGMIEKHGFDLSAFIKEREKHLAYLEKHLITS